MLTRRLVCAAAPILAASPAFAAEPDIVGEQDFDELWETLRDRYCFFADKATDWQKVRDLYRPLAIAAQSDKVYVEVLRLTLNELYDAHTHLSDPPDGTPRWPPFDLVVERDADAAVIRAVQEGSAAATAGLQPGDRIIAVEDQPIAALAKDLMPRCLSRPDAEAERYAWNAAVSGRRREGRRLTVSSGAAPARVVALPLSNAAAEPALSSRRLEGGLGYIRIASFAEPATVPAFDSALETVKGAPGLILDVRRNGGGDTAVARPIMGRFISERKPYARMRRRSGAGLSEPWSEYVDPRGPFTYSRPVVVLTDAWSASMAEGFPMGMRGLGRARIVGRPMAGLGAAVFPLRLDRTGIEAQYSAEPVYDVNDKPRWLLQPDVPTAPGADILAAGVRELTRMIGR
jgi:carboxyl-terminal processing protease